MQLFPFRTFRGRNNYQARSTGPAAAFNLWQNEDYTVWLTEPLSKKNAPQRRPNPPRKPPMAGGKMADLQSANTFLSCSAAGVFTKPTSTRSAFLNRKNAPN